MADNLAVTAGAGTTISADDIGAGVLVQRVKATWGPDGTANDTDDAAGKRLPVKIAEVAADPFGATADAAVDTDTTGSISGKLRGLVKLIIAMSAKLPAALGQGTMAQSMSVTVASNQSAVPVTIPASELLVGLVGASDIQVAVTPTMDTGAYTANDVWFTATEIAAAARVSGGTTILQSLTILDKDDQTAAAVDLYFFDRTVTLGTINAAVSISDADAAYYVGHVSIAAGDWKDLINSKVACKMGLGLAMKANATSLFVAAVTAGTPTNTASGVYLKFSFLRS